MPLLPFLPSGGTSYPGFSQLTGKHLQIFGPQDSVTPILDIDDNGFRNAVTLNGAKFGIYISNISVAYDEGSSMTIVTSEDWTNPQIMPGCRVLFWADVGKTHTIVPGQPSWVLNAQTTGNQLLFSGKIDNAALQGDPSSGHGATYSCMGWLYWANLVDVVLDYPSGFRLPERLYNVDVTDDPAEYRRSIKKAGSLLIGKSQYGYTPYGYTGIVGPNSTHATGAPNNTTDNKKMTTGEIIKDLFATHGGYLKREGCIPDNWDRISGQGTLPFVQAELDTMDLVPQKIVLAGPMKFLEALKFIVRKSYPNYSIAVDRNKVWHFTPILDNLKITATKPEDIYAPQQWMATRLGVITLKLAEPVGDGDKRVFGKLISANINQGISDRYTAVRLVGHEVVVTSEASTLNAQLSPAWGNGNASQQTNLQSGYVQGGLEASINRHWDRGDHGLGIPVYKCEPLTGYVCKVTFKGYNSELWPHTNDEWNGTTMLLGNSLNEIQSGNWVWVQSSQRYTVLDCYNVANVGDGKPGFAVEVDGRGQLVPLSVQTEFSSGNEQGARIQLTADFGLDTTINPNQLSVTYRTFKIEETTTTIGDSLNNDPSTPCNIRGVIGLGSRANQPVGGIPGAPNAIEQYGQSLGQTSMTALGRMHSQAKGGEFWFGGSLIIPFSAIKKAPTKYKPPLASDVIPNACNRGGAQAADEVKVVYEKSTQTFREMRVPALSPSGEDTYAGTAYLAAGVRRELILKMENFLDDSQKPDFEKLAGMILRTVSDMEPSGTWEWIETSKYLSLVDLHFRLGIDWYVQWGGPVGGGGGNMVGIQQAVVTKINYDFEKDTVSMSLDTRYNPLGSYAYENLQEAFISAKRLKEIEEARAKAERIRQCRDSLNSLNNQTDQINSPICSDQVVRSSGPGKGKSSPPLSCHATDDGGLTMDIGVQGSAAGGSSGGYATSQYNQVFSMSNGIGWMLEPFIDTRGELFFYDRFGGIQAGEQGNITPGVVLQPSVVVGSGDPNWKNDPLRKSHEMATLALDLLTNLTGMKPSEPAATKYNMVKAYDPVTGQLDLVYDNLNGGLYAGGMALVSNGANDNVPMYIFSNGAGALVLQAPRPTAAQVPIGAHCYVVARRKPLPNPYGTLDRQTRMFKDQNDTWYGMAPNGQVKAILIDDPNKFVPLADEDTSLTQPFPTLVQPNSLLLGGWPSSSMPGSVLTVDKNSAIRAVPTYDGLSNVREWLSSGQGTQTMASKFVLDATGQTSGIKLTDGVLTQFVANEIIRVPQWVDICGDNSMFKLRLQYYTLWGNGGFKWRLKFRWRLVSSVTVLNSAAYTTSDLDITVPNNNIRQIFEITVSSPVGTLTPGYNIQLDLARDGAHANDNLTGGAGNSDVYLTNFNILSGVKYNSG